MKSKMVAGKTKRLSRVLRSYAEKYETAFFIEGDPSWFMHQASGKANQELTAVVRSRQLHIYRNGKKVLVLAGKAAPKVIREDKLCEILQKEK